jgi:hypothetical protein
MRSRRRNHELSDLGICPGLQLAAASLAEHPPQPPVEHLCACGTGEPVDDSAGTA